RCPAAAGPPSARATCSTCVNNSARRSRPRITNSPPACATRFDRRKPRMNLDSLIPTTGEWLRGTGPEADIVVSTRIRLARNLAAFPFTNRASAHQKAEVEALLRERIAKLDLLEQKISYAFSEDFGYLTACPTNVGTGMRASVMLHLPALGLTKQIEKVFRALQKINLVVRGLYGEGSRASGDFYQISNQVTLG